MKPASEHQADHGNPTIVDIEGIGSDEFGLVVDVLARTLVARSLEELGIVANENADHRGGRGGTSRDS